MSARSRGLVLPAVVLAALAAQLGSARADGGAFDPTFGDGGLTITANPNYVGEEPSDVGAVALQPDGKIVVGGFIHPAGSQNPAFTVERYTADGLLDPSFGTNGVVTTDLGSDWEQVWGLAIQPDGKIVAAGVDGGAVALARYAPDGTLDMTFGGGPIPGTEIDGSITGGAYSVALQADGKIVVAGGYQGMTLARYDPNGTRDITFGNGGIVAPPPRAFEYGADVALTPQGKILLSGSEPNGLPVGPGRSFVVKRFNPDGSPDLAFGSGGAATVSVGAWDYAGPLRLQPDGKILLGATAELGNTYHLMLMRFQAEGVLDDSFGDHGIVTTDQFSQPAEVLLQPDGEIVVADPGFALERYLPDGSLDTSFGVGGFVKSPFGGNPPGPHDSGSLRAAALQPDGRVVAAGSVFPADPSSGENSFALARYLTSDTHQLTVTKPFAGAFGSVTSNPRGIDCEVVCGQDEAQFADWSPVTLTAATDAGSAVVWSGACAGSGPVCTVRMGAARSVAVRFVRCTVPRLVGKRVAAAKRAIRAGHCTVGRVRLRFSRKVARGRVISQSSRAGASRAAFAKVGLTVSRGRR